MKKNIKIGEKEVPFEGNMGTARLFERFTGKNIYQSITNKARTAQGDITAAFDLYDDFQRLAFVMNTQATHTDIKEMMDLMNEDEFILWLCQFDEGELSETVLIEIAAVWNSQTKTNSTLKNA